MPRKRNTSILLLPTVWTGLKEAMLHLLHGNIPPASSPKSQLREKIPYDLLVLCLLLLSYTVDSNHSGQFCMTACVVCSFAMHLVQSLNYKMSLLPNCFKLVGI